MVHFNRNREHQALVLFSELPKYNSRDRISAAFSACVRKACKRDPRQRRKVNQVVTQGRLQGTASSSDVVYCARRRTNKLFEIELVIKVSVGKALIWQQHRGSPIDYVIDKYAFIFEPVTEWFDFVCDRKG